MNPNPTFAQLIAKATPAVKKLAVGVRKDFIVPSPR